MCGAFFFFRQHFYELVVEFSSAPLRSIQVAQNKRKQLLAPVTLEAARIPSGNKIIYIV